jgi:alkylation response protein AidB-like acyl-CoA dehydrogenase
MHHLTGQRVLTTAATGGPPGPESSIAKLFFCALVEDLADFALSLHDMGGQFDVDETGEADRDRWVRLAYQARGTAIAGGTTFIQRNIVSERVLGMPRGR